MASPASTLLFASPARRAGREFLRALPRLAGATRFFVDAVRIHKKALHVSVLSLLSFAAWSATPPNTLISNTATASYSIGATALSSTGTAAINTAACISVGVKIELMQYIPPAAAAFAPSGASNILVPLGEYSPDGSAAAPFAPLSAPVPLGSTTPLALPATLLLAPLSDGNGKPISVYSRNEPVFVRVVSFDANIDPALADTVSVTLTTSGGDIEVIRLSETGPSTGEFIAAVPSTFIATGSSPVAYDGKIAFSSNFESLSGVYNHNDCVSGSTVASSTSGLIDPYGMVFDSTTGLPVNGATITLIDTLTGLPATAYCDDAVTVLPQPVTSGSPTICDATMVAGGFRFPQVALGSYKISVVPPAGYAFPSAVAPANLPATIGTPPDMDTTVISGGPGPTPGGSYGGVFSLIGPALHIDIPVDPGAKNMTILKSAGKTVVSTGDFVPYTLAITNNLPTPLTGAKVADLMPPGFRYQKGSARMDGAPIADPLASPDGRTLTFSLDIAAAATATIRYVLEVTSGARAGNADNVAAATGGISSNTARARVLVREDLYRNKAILIGRVIDGPCDDKADNDMKGLANARIVLQDGTYALTDQEGRWHIDNLRAGTHVVQLDLDSLPGDYEVVACEQNNRFAGRTYSQFVNVRSGTLWRADFHVRKKAPETMKITQVLSAQPLNEKSAVTLTLDSGTEVTGYSATVMLPDSAKYVPGSAKLNGAAIADPDSAGSALIFRSKTRPARWQDQYSFEVSGVAPSGAIKSLVRFTPPGRAAQGIPLAEIRLAGDEPASATTSAEVTVEAAVPGQLKTPGDDDPARLVEILPYDEAWLAAAQPGVEWLHPQESFLPALPAIKIAVKHAPGQTVRLRLNGEEVSPLYYDGAVTNAAKTVSLATWRGVHIKDNDNLLELVVTDASGKEVLRQSRKIRYTVSADRVELVPEHSRLIADGKTRPVIAVRFLDKDGYRMRRGINGEFTLNEPYRSYDRREGIDREPLAGRLGGKPRYEIRTDGLAMIELEPTTQSGEAVLNFQFNDRRQQEVRAWLEAGQRDWILVGFGEGTLGHKTLSGNVQELKDADADRQLFDNNKLALYAKGSIRGDYLLTIAYDTSKETGNKLLKQAIDPTQYYTLYADATQAGFDAASSSRLYVKLERKQFYAMFGDYDTGLTVTELSRYSRTLNGVKSEYKGETFGYNAFATVTAQAYVKDEIPGNGTSGVYKLSRGNLMINTDKVRIETRDRFQSQIIVSAQSLTRYLDYDIDYHNGTLTFREPVNSRDGNFNPTYIVAEYESADPADEKATMGGRASFKPARGIEVGATVIHEGTVGATGELKGMDVTYQPDDKTKVRAEVAATDRNLGNVSSGGNAWLGEVTHHEEQWDAKAYVRDQAGAFGMGQQAASESATRKMGMEGRYKLSDAAQLLGQAYQQDNLTSGASNSMLEGRVDNRIGDDMSAYYGARTSRDESTAGSAQSNQLLGGAAYTMLDKRLMLHSSAEISGGTAGSSAMPDRLILGADYKVTEQSKIFAEQEFARGEKISANTTRAGVRTQPWAGNEMSASVGNSINNDAERLYANLGMVQRWQISEHWQSSFSIDRSQTLHNSATPLNINSPLPSGSGGISQLPSASGDYTASSVSLAYHDTLWSSDGRIEIRDSSLDRQRNLQLGLQRHLDQGRTIAAGYTLRQTDSAASYTRNTDLRVSYAHRPNDSQWVWFDRADYITQFNQTAGSVLNGAKLVNNLNANYMPARDLQIALQYGAKYVRDTIDSTDYKGYTDLIGAEVRRDLTKKWDMGASGSVMRSLNSGVRSYGLGASVGYKVVDNMWLSVGYNVRGMNDRDFAAGSYRAQGPYITLRMKVDQDTFGLNKGIKANRPEASK
jgi:uncharacterized repeat protein (TIGR01451 family)